MKDCDNIQCKQVHLLLDSLLAHFGHMGGLNDPSATKSAQLMECIRQLEHDATQPYSSREFVKYWDSMNFKQHCLLAAQSLLKAASLVE
jgi:hypothetical protein